MCHLNVIFNQICVGLLEIPDEISLIIPIAGCGNHCKNCHSPEFQSKENGILISENEFRTIILNYVGKVSCICFFEGLDRNIKNFLQIIKQNGFKTALYTGSDTFDTNYDFDYIKYGHYDQILGGLKEKTTNQILLKKEKDNRWINITNRFWRTYD
jgi:anaerobic ribonucleoside-triphosphate reductase activating protein